MKLNTIEQIINNIKILAPQNKIAELKIYKGLWDKFMEYDIINLTDTILDYNLFDNLTIIDEPIIEFDRFGEVYQRDYEIVLVRSFTKEYNWDAKLMKEAQGLRQRLESEDYQWPDEKIQNIE